MAARTSRHARCSLLATSQGTAPIPAAAGTNGLQPARLPGVHGTIGAEPPRHPHPRYTPSDNKHRRLGDLSRLLPGDALAEPGQGERVAVVDAHVTGVEQLEADHVAGYPGIAQRCAERLRAEVEVPL